MPGIQALSFVDDVAWLAEGKDENNLSATLEAAVSAAQQWAKRTRARSTRRRYIETILLSRRTTTVAQERGIQVGEQLFHFNKQATRWLGVWMDSHLTLGEHHNVRTKKARVVQGRLRRLAGHMARRRRTAAVRMQPTSKPPSSSAQTAAEGGGRDRNHRDDIQKLIN